MLVAVFLLVGSLVYAQPTTRTEPAGTSYPNGWTKTTTVSTDQSLRQVVTIEIKNEHRQIRCRSTWTRALNGELTATFEQIFLSGKSIIDSYTMNDKGVIQTREITDVDGRTLRLVRNSSGGLSNEKGLELIRPEDLLDMESQRRGEFDKIRKDELDKLETACSQFGTCSPRAEIFGGYSYLNISDDGNSESFPVGVEVAIIYNIRPHVGVGVDVSYHTKKVNGENFSNIFALATLNYKPGNVKSCNRKLAPDVHVMAGMGSQKFAGTSYSGFAFGGGASLAIRLSKKVNIGVRTDWIGVKFKEIDKMVSNFRASVGIGYRWQRKFSR